MRLQRLSLLWQLIEKAAGSEDHAAWKALYKNFKPMFGGNEMFEPQHFMEYTEGLRGFLGGKEDDDFPQNIGVAGFLRELEKNGLGAATAYDKEAKYFDAAAGLDDVERMMEICSGISIRDLVDKLQRPREINIPTTYDDADRRRAKFIAAATKACI